MFRRRIAVALVAALALLGLAACGGHHKQPAHKPAASSCPPNRSYVGCATKATPAPRKLTATPPGPLFPDVSVWQGAVNWDSVAAWQRQHGWAPAAIFKLGEYTLDTFASRNASETSRLGFWRAGYWFVRPTGCAHESALILWAAQRYGLKAIMLDEEVPGLAGYAACLSAPLKAAGLAVALYTSPGTWSGGSTAGLSIWVASYGPAHPPCFATCSVGDLTKQSILAWQCTNGQVGCVTDIPGIGRDDVSVDYGLTRLGVPHVTPQPDYAVLTPLERQWALRYDGARKHPAQYAGYLKGVLEPELGTLAHAIWTVAHTPGQGGWTVRNRGERFQQTYRRSLGQQLAQ